jgi:hypothetical protein
MQFNGQNYVQDKDGGWVITDAPVFAPVIGAKGTTTVAETIAADNAIKALQDQDKKDLRLGVTALTAYRGDLGAVAHAHAVSAHNYQPANANIQTHIAIVAGNPHGTTLANLGYVEPTLEDLYVAPTVANSVAVDIAGLVADFNALLAELRTAGILTV